MLAKGTLIELTDSLCVFKCNRQSVIAESRTLRLEKMEESTRNRNISTFEGKFFWAIEVSYWIGGLFELQ